MGNFHSKNKEKAEIIDVKNEFYEPSQLLNGILHRALFDYRSRKKDELSFQANDLMIVVVKEGDSWWMAQHKETFKMGFVPNNFITKFDSKHNMVPGWCEITRFEADQKLKLNCHQMGTYLIRPCSDNKHLVLSIKCLDEHQQVFVKHLRIVCKVREYFIDRRRKFSSLSDLIGYYQRNNEGLVCKLNRPLKTDSHLAIQFPDIEIERAQLQFKEKIGRGQFGEVFMADLFDTKVAVKKLLKETGDRLTFLKEARLMHQLHHRRIVELIGVCTFPECEPVFIITELMSNGSLRNYLRSNHGQLVTFNQMLVMLTEISEGMAYLEYKSYIHRDLRTANILVASDMSVKVADFGLAGLIEDIYIYAENDFQFPIRWVAEEVLCTNKFTLKSDVWSFGVLMAEVIMYGEVPYKDLTNDQVRKKVKNGYRLQRPLTSKINCPDKFYDIMDSCWRKHRDRPSFKELFILFKYWDDDSDLCSSSSSLSDQ